MKRCEGAARHSVDKRLYFLGQLDAPAFGDSRVGRARPAAEFRGGPCPPIVNDHPRSIRDQQADVKVWQMNDEEQGPIAEAEPDSAGEDDTSRVFRS